MKFTKYLMIVPLLCLCACSDDDDDQANGTPTDMVELKVDANEMNIVQGETRVVNIVSGNGEYTVTSANEEVVTAKIDGNKIKLTAVPGENNAQGVVYLKDKYYQRVKIQVNTAAEFDLKLKETSYTLYSNVEGEDEAVVEICTGNGGYS